MALVSLGSIASMSVTLAARAQASSENFDKLFEVLTLTSPQISRDPLGIICLHNVAHSLQKLSIGAGSIRNAQP